jgi:O-antigen/teichoic acid export membrane protein
VRSPGGMRPVKSGMSVARRVAFNTVAQFVSRLFVALLTLAIIRLSTRYLGARSYGHLVTITSFVTIFSALADWGLAVIAAREIARDQDRAEELIGLNLGLRLTVSLAAIPLALFMAWVLYSDASPQVRTGITLLSGILLTNSVATSAGAIFVARVRNEIPAVIESGARVLWLGGVLLIVSTGSSFFSFIWLQLGVSTVIAGTTVLVARRFVKLRPLFRPRLWKPIVVMSIPLGIVHAINLIYFRLDSVILSVLRSPSEVGYYGVAYRVIDLVMGLPGFLMIALMPALVVAKRDRLRHLIQRAFDVLVSLAIPILLGGILLRSHIVVAISSPEFAPAATPLAILMFGAAFSFVNGVFGHALIALGHQARLIPVAVLALTMNLGLNLLLVPGLGTKGAAIATAATEGVALGYVTYLFRRTTGLTPSLRLVPRFLLGSLVMAAAGLGALQLLEQPNLWQLALLVGLLGGIYLAALALLRALPVGSVRALLSPGK